jgi:hypothetical protein
MSELTEPKYNPNNTGTSNSTTVSADTNTFNTATRVANFQLAAEAFRKKQSEDTIFSNRDVQPLNIAATIFGTAAAATGITQLSPILTNLINRGGSLSTYSTSPIRQAYNIPGTIYNDFRSRKSNIALGLSLDTRYDGASAITSNGKFNPRAALYLAASKTPGGIYNLFNRDAPGKFGYGWGDHGSPNAIRVDFTLRSQVATKWSNSGTGGWEPILATQAIPFRGDRVNVIDYRKNVTLNQAYEWRRSGLLDTKDAELLKRPLQKLINKLDQTQDFIKFFLTGPKLHPGATTETDEIIVFRATMDSITDSFQPQWTPVNMIGRADPNYHYSSYSRDVSVDFTIYATDRDEMKPIYRKLNALAGFTAPDYSGNTIGLTGPWMRITIGDLFNQVPVIISSLSYTFGDSESPWEINIENDATMMQVPFKIQVSLSFSVISDFLPQKGGQFYSLAKRHDTFGPLQGSDNWLSDNMQQNQLKVLRDAKIKADTDAAAAAKTAADEKSKQSTTAQTTSEFNDMSNPLLPPTG